MTSSSSSARVHWAAIGAYELKRTYQRNMVLGILASILLYAALLALMALANTSVEQNPINDGEDWVDGNVFIGDPPPTVIDDLRERGIEDVEPPDFALPEAVPDEEVAHDYTLVTREELSKTIGPGSEGGTEIGNGRFTTGPGTDIFPEPEEFVAFDIGPEMLRLEQPVYPAIARRAGIQGEVWVKVLIDTEGKVRDAVVYIESGANAGFEEAAIAAALHGKWRPAMQNNQPVAVWAAYRVEFKLR